MRQLEYNRQLRVEDDDCRLGPHFCLGATAAQALMSEHATRTNSYTVLVAVLLRAADDELARRPPKRHHVPAVHASRSGSS